MDNILNKFSERLIDKMIEKEIKQKELSAALGTTQQTISRWIKGINEPNLTDLIRICILLEEDPNFMLGFDEVNENTFNIYEATILKEETENFEQNQAFYEMQEEIERQKAEEEYNFVMEPYFTKAENKLKKFRNIHNKDPKDKE